MASKENQLSLVLFQGVPTENVSAHHDSATQVTTPAEEVVTRERNTDTAPGRENEATSPGRDSSDQTRYRYPEVVVWTHPRDSEGGNADATTSRPPSPTERPQRPASDDIVVVEEVPSESGSSTFSERRRRRRRERALEYRRQRRHRLQENSDGEDNATDVNSDSGSDVVPRPPRPAQVRPQDRRTNTNSSSQAAQTNPAGRDISAGIESSRFSIAAIRRALRRMLHLPPPPYDPEAGQAAEGSDDDDDPRLLSTRSETWKHAILHSLLPDGFRITHDRDSWVNVRDVTLRYLNAATGNVTYGELLNAIYDGGALPRPPQEHGHSRAHLDDLRSLLFAMNVWNRGRVYDFRWTQSSLSDRAALPICGTSPTTLRVRPPRSVGGRSVDSHGTARGGDVATFSADDLDIASLREFGRIHIEWTDNIEDHLELVPCGSADEDLSEDSDDSDDESEEDTFLRRERKRRSRNRGMTLRIFWFETMEIKWLAKYVDPRLGRPLYPHRRSENTDFVQTSLLRLPSHRRRTHPRLRSHLQLVLPLPPPQGLAAPARPTSLPASSPTSLRRRQPTRPLQRGRRRHRLGHVRRCAGLRAGGDGLRDGQAPAPEAAAGEQEPRWRVCV